MVPSNAAALGVHCTRTVEQALCAAGAVYRRNDSVFVPHVVHDGRLHTGRNPASSEAPAIEFAQDMRS
ncbi:hypothetical protein [Streptomyces sp. NPDC101234]|uniref:hypothetical protein n=1 Tax=Streptomyces sp. NPDC101234 TaxID=3366138 RepID=UPI0037FDC766